MKKLFCLGSIVLFLFGCTTSVKFDPVAHKELRTIGLVEVENPPEYSVYDSFSTERTKRAVLDGLLGVLILGVGETILPSSKKEATGILQKEISDSGFNPGRQMTEELTKSLQNANYEVIVVSRNEMDKINADAYLMVTLGGFDGVGAHSGVGYRYSSTSCPDNSQGCVAPSMVAAISLSSRSKQKIYSSHIGYGEEGCTCGETIKSPLRYHFDLIKPENRGLIVEGLQAGIAAIAEKIASDLRK